MNKFHMMIMMGLVVEVTCKSTATVRTGDAHLPNHKVRLETLDEN